jgi:phosphatidylglycerol---prolipoprotein diacylglyceryl transferase
MIPYFSFQEINLNVITIQTWGLMASLGFLVALFFSLKEGKSKGIDKESLWDIITISLIGIIAGSRVFYVLFNFEKFDNIFGVLNIYKNGGFSLLGGIITAIPLIYIYAKKKKINIYMLADILTPGIIISIIIARLGCFLVYDHIGKITNLPWAQLYIDQTARHPVALYYIINAVVISSIICYLKKRRLNDGVLALLIALYYSISRFFLEFTRCSDLELCDSRLYNFTFNQWFLLFAIPFIIYFLKKRIK